MLPTQATLRAEISSIGGEVKLIENILDRSFTYGSLPGMQAWYSAQDMNGDNLDDAGNVLSNGDQVIQWMDGSGQTRNMLYTSGNPRFYSSALKGKPVISFDGNDMIWGMQILISQILVIQSYLLLDTLVVGTTALFHLGQQIGSLAFMAD